MNAEPTDGSRGGPHAPGMSPLVPRVASVRLPGDRPRPPSGRAREDGEVMEAPEVLARRLMSAYEDRLPLRQICDEILVVLRDGGLRIGDPVPADLAADAE